MKVAKNILSNLIYARLVHLCDDELGKLNPHEDALAEAVFLTQSLQKLNNNKKRMVIDIDLSNDGYGKQ